MDGLNRLLMSALERPSVRDWLTSEDRAALGQGSGVTPRGARVLGRLLRAGDLSVAEMRELDGWLRQPAHAADAAWEVVARQAWDDLDAVERAVSAKPDETAVLRLRDDVESALCTMGRAVLAIERDGEPVARRERALLERATAVDGVALANLPELALGSQPVGDPWLVRAASLDGAPWWLDRVSLLELRRKVGSMRWPSPALPGSRAIRLQRRHLTHAPPPEVVGCEDDLARDASTHGTLVARLFEGEVEVLAIGLAAGDAVEAGLCVRRRGGGAAGIDGVESVAPGAVRASRSASGWWIPLSSVEKSAEFVVHFQGVSALREERVTVVVEA